MSESLSEETINTALTTVEKAISTAAGVKGGVNPSELASLARAAHDCAKARDRLAHSQGRGVMAYVAMLKDINDTLLKPVVTAYLETLKTPPQPPIDRTVS